MNSVKNVLSSSCCWTIKQTSSINTLSSSSTKLFPTVHWELVYFLFRPFPSLSTFSLRQSHYRYSVARKFGLVWVVKCAIVFLCHGYLQRTSVIMSVVPVTDINFSCTFHQEIEHIDIGSFYRLDHRIVIFATVWVCAGKFKTQVQLGLTQPCRFYSQRSWSHWACQTSWKKSLLNIKVEGDKNNRLFETLDSYFLSCKSSFKGKTRDIVNKMCWMSNIHLDPLTEKSFS